MMCAFFGEKNGSPSKVKIIVKNLIVANIKKVILRLFYLNKNVTFFIFSIAKSNIYFYNRKGVQYIILEK